MNKRIKELAEQAENHAYRVAAAGDDCQEAYTQKFAELMIKECANIARQTETDDSDDYKSGRTWASLDILEHFGV